MARTIYGRRRALVTGGAGFLGSHLIDRLLARGDEVLCVDNLFTGDKSNRVHFASTFIPEADIPAYFAAAGAVALTYTRSFVSQSGVLQIAALFDRPLLASGGEGPLRETVERFGLGSRSNPIPSRRSPRASAG